MYWSSSWTKILHVHDIIKERTKETSSNISSTRIPSNTIARADHHSFETCFDVPRTEDVGLPTKFRLNVGPALQPIAGSMPVNRLRRWPNTNLSPGLFFYFAQIRGFQPILFQCWPHSLRLWPVIETALGDCIMLVTFKIPAPDTPDSTIHWPDADVMLGHRLRINLLSFNMFFYFPKIIFFGNRQQFNARWQKKHVFLVMHGLNLTRALI